VVNVPGVMGGSPVIEGTRIRVADIVCYRRLGYSKPRILKALPHLNEEQVKAALAYYERDEDTKRRIDDDIAAEQELARQTPVRGPDNP